jgi:hypothetical protein
MEKLSDTHCLTEKAIQNLKKNLDVIHSNDNVVQQGYELFRSSAIKAFELSSNMLLKFTNLYF